MTFANLLLDLYRRLNYSTTPAAEVTTRLTAFLAEALQDVMSEPGIGAWIARNQPPITVASVIGQATYAIPASVARIDAVTDRTNDWQLDMRPFDWYRRQEPDPTSHTGTPSVWVPLGFQPVTSQPSAATGLWAVSTSASDTTQSVKLETIRTGGYPFSGAIALNGVTRVALSASATDHVSVTKFYVSAVGVGTIELYDAATVGTLLGTIAIGQTFARYQAIALWPTPAAVITYYIDGERDLLDMANPTDEPPFPARFHRILVDGALFREWEKKDRADLAQGAKRRFDQAVAQFRYVVTCPPDFLPSRGRWGVERSRLGAQFPATRW